MTKAHIHILKDANEVSVKAADMIQEVVEQNERPVLGLATGSTPLGMYRELIDRYQAGEIDFSAVRTFNLDEYYGLAPDHPQSYYQFMMKSFFEHVNVPLEQIHIPHGKPTDVQAYCQQYDAWIEKAGGIDLQILGIGVNGHIGFNEPADELQPFTHLVRLKEETIEANARFFERREDVPQYAITMGIRNILQAKKIILLAIGEDKAAAVAGMLNAGITTRLPATFLQLHDHVHVLVDEAAASKLVSTSR